MAQFTEYGKTVKKRLIDNNMTQEDLIKLIAGETNLFVDKGYLYKILTGQRKAPTIVSSINDILDIKEAQQ